MERNHLCKEYLYVSILASVHHNSVVYTWLEVGETQNLCQLQIMEQKQLTNGENVNITQLTVQIFLAHFIIC